MKHYTESPFHRRYSVLPAVLLLITALTGTAWAQDRTSIAQLEKQYDVRSYMGVIWVERNSPFVSDLNATDQSLMAVLFDQVALASWLAERSFPEEHNKHVIVVIPVRSADMDSGIAAYVDQATTDQAILQDEDGIWYTDFTAFLSGAIISPCDRDELADLQQYEQVLTAMMDDHRERIAEAEDEVAAIAVEAATRIGMQYMAEQLADEIEQFQPPAYRRIIGGTPYSRTIVSDYWPRELERMFDIHQTGDVVWVDFGTGRSVSPYTAYGAVAPALAYAHMRLGDALAHTTVCVLIENEVENRENGGYVAAISPDTIGRVLSLSGTTRYIDVDSLQMQAAIGEASTDQVNAFRAVRDRLLLQDTVDADLPTIVERAVGARTRGAWITVATAGGNYVFSPRELAMAEVTVFIKYLGGALSAGYRTVPYAIETGDRYRTSAGSYETAAETITITTDEIVARASFSVGTEYFRMDLLQLVFPVRIGLESSISDIDLEDALDNRVSRYRSGFSIAQGFAGRIGPLYLGFTFDWGRWIWSDAPPQVNLYAGLSLKAGFRYRMGLLE